MLLSGECDQLETSQSSHWTISQLEYCQGSLRSYRYTRQQYTYRGNSVASHHNDPSYTGHLSL